MKSKRKRGSYLFILPRKLRNGILAILMSLMALGFCWAAEKLTHISLPVSEEAPILYSTQIHNDLELTFEKSILQAKHSILLIIYTLTDQRIIEALKQKSQEGLSVTVLCDGRDSPSADRKLGPGIHVIKRFGDNIMHQKILVVDQAQVWIGSANMTRDSLKMHGNLVLGFYSPALAEMITQKAKTMPEEGRGVPFTHRDFLMGGQKVEMWFLPDNPQAVQKIKSLISGAQKTLRIAMFTWTRMDFAEEVAKAFNRGVQVSVALDHYAAQGAGLKVTQFLKKKGIPVYFNLGPGLLHYKFMEIDGEILVNGSANWTKAAFSMNDDCFVILHRLTPEQQEQMDTLWKAILMDSKK